MWFPDRKFRSSNITRGSATSLWTPPPTSIWRKAICFNAKVQRPGVCNAMETLLVHRDIAPRFLPAMAEKLITAGVELRGCPETRRILPLVKPARKEDWSAEYLDLILSVKIVAGSG